MGTEIKMADDKKAKSPEEVKREYEAKQEEYKSDLKTFAYGAVAGNAIANKDFERAGSSLEKLIVDMELDSKKISGLQAAATETSQTITTASKVYAGIYQKAMGGLTISNLWNFYGEYADKYLGDLKGKAGEEMEKFKDIEFGKIMKKYFSAKEKVESETDNFSKEDKEKAGKELEKYKKVVATLSTLGEAYLDKYENGVTEQSRKDLLKSLYAEKPKEIQMNSQRRMAA